MEKTELTVSMEPERLDALRYFLAAKNKRTPQKELQRALEELYEAYVPAETRAYLDARCRPDRDRRRRPAASKATHMYMQRNSSPGFWETRSCAKRGFWNIGSSC